jgi:hypothetical protein
MATLTAADLPQHLSALQRANVVRRASAQIKREIAAGETTVRAALYDERAGCIPVLDLLMAQRRWGRQRSVKLLANLGPWTPTGSSCSIRENRRVDELTQRQRTALARATAQMR